MPHPDALSVAEPGQLPACAPGPDESYLQIADGIATQGYVICPEFLPASTVQALLGLAQAHERTDALSRAGIGRGQDFQTNRFVRQDRIHWLHTEDPTARLFLDPMRALQQTLNRELFIGLFDYEAHLALFPAGAFYKKHLDAFKGRTNRRLSTVLYLNFDWQSDQGGELRCFDPEDDQRVLFDLLPQAGTLFVFDSERFWHEVLPAQRNRYSIAGWFRVNGSINGVVDPPR